MDVHIEFPRLVADLGGQRSCDRLAAVISDSVFTDNGTGIYNVGAVTVTNSVIVSNPTAIANAGALYTRQNNTLGGSTTGNTPIPYGAF